MKIVNLFPLSIVQERITLEENTKSEMNKEIEAMVSKSKNKVYKNKDSSWTGDTQGFEYLHKNKIDMTNISTTGEFNDTSIQKVKERIELFELDNIRIIEGSYENSVPNFFSKFMSVYN